MPTNKKIFKHLFFFTIGVIATIAYRAIIVLNDYSDYWVDVTWYIGTIGFTWYFWHRYKIENRRDELVTEFKLVEKIENNTPLAPEEKQALVKVLNGLQTSLAKWNYIIIFVSSFIAIAYAIYFDLK
ncbi:MAG: hypothetical protein WAW11_05045 [Patescibacteria group bacterium]